VLSCRSCVFRYAMPHGAGSSSLKQKKRKVLAVRKKSRKRAAINGDGPNPGQMRREALYLSAGAGRDSRLLSEGVAGAGEPETVPRWMTKNSRFGRKYGRGKKQTAGRPLQSATAAASSTTVEFSDERGPLGPRRQGAAAVAAAGGAAAAVAAGEQQALAVLVRESAPQQQRAAAAASSAAAAATRLHELLVVAKQEEKARLCVALLEQQRKALAAGGGGTGSGGGGGGGGARAPKPKAVIFVTTAKTAKALEARLGTYMRIPPAACEFLK